MALPSETTRRVHPIDQAEMVWVESGPFTQGSSAEEIAAIIAAHPDWRAEWFAQEQPQRLVTLPGFWIYRVPVTVAQFQAFCAETGWSMPHAPEAGWRDDHPMVNVSWRDAEEYAAWAQAALPTEAQWEKAARGTDRRLYPWGDDWRPELCHFAAGEAGTEPVGRRPGNASPCGALDLAGNVWEWCEAAPLGEYASAQPRTARATPQRKPTPSGRVLRGGSFQCAYPAYLRCAYRSFDCDGQRMRGAYRRPTVGFRCVVPAE